LVLINWLYVSIFWLTLYDMGQISSVSYGISGSVDFSSPTFHTSANNIFVNNTLFQSYSSYLRNVILESTFFQLSYLPDFLPLSNTNSLKPIDTPIYRTYSCSKRQLKGWFSVLISVLAADYALLAGLYTIVIYITGKFQKRKDLKSDPT
jgi:hypothetical protein